MELFYGQEIIDQHILLSEEESRHCIKVLRKTEGEEIHVINGLGSLFKGKLKLDKKGKQARVAITETFYYENDKNNSRFHLAIAPTKHSDRMEWMLEKLVELGISSITFLKCEHSERHNLRMDRLKKIAISALKQSRQYWLPQIHSECSFDQFLETFPQDWHAYIAHCEKSDKIEFESSTIQKPCCILIGPEGDFSFREIEAAKQKGFRAVSLGESRLRTETAAIHACSIYRNKISTEGGK